MAIEIAIIVSTFERPGHLARCLASLSAQRGVDGLFEVVVTDDGSRDSTLSLVSAWAKAAPFPLSYTTHDHDGFQLARSRNEGIRASTAAYLLFTDGDCILPADHLQVHLEERRPGRIGAGDCFRLGQEASQRVDLDAVRSGSYRDFLSRREVARLRGKAWRARLYERLRVPMRPRVSGNNIAVWRDDLERINGFDERFVGWGFEDRDLQERLERIGVRAHSILDRTAPIHLWHPPASTFARNGANTPNRAYFERADRPTFCRDGLAKTDAGMPPVVSFPRRESAARRAA